MSQMTAQRTSKATAVAVINNNNNNSKNEAWCVSMPSASNMPTPIKLAATAAERDG
jgi:hypothetical protein